MSPFIVFFTAKMSWNAAALGAHCLNAAYWWNDDKLGFRARGFWNMTGSFAGLGLSAAEI